MKLVTILICAAIMITSLISSIRGNFRFENDYGHMWTLADRASTIEAKRDGIGKFAEAIELNKRGFSTHNALVLKTPSNSLNGNLEALQTLAARLNEIGDLDPKSFEYNIAIQQVTGQEQGEADRMISVIQGAYMLQNYPLAWDWIALVMNLTALLVMVGAIVMVLEYGWE